MKIRSSSLVVERVPFTVMIRLSDNLWNDFIYGDNPACVSVECLKRLYQNADDDEAWQELWDELHHQGDIGQESYAAVPHILEIESRAKHFNWNGFALIATIEQDRPENAAPRAGAIANGYQKAWDDLLKVIANHPQKDWDSNLTRSILSCIAYSRGQRTIARAVMEINEPVAENS